MTELARSEFEIAWVGPRSSLRNRSETIRPAGSSAPRLIRRPVASRCNRNARSAFDRARFACAIMDEMLVLILAMAILLDCG